MRGLMWPLLCISVLVGGCASSPVRIDGVSGAVAWHAADVQLAKASVQGQCAPSLTNFRGPQQTRDLPPALADCPARHGS
jgi:hypothetical protein